MLTGMKPRIWVSYLLRHIKGILSIARAESRVLLWAGAIVSVIVAASGFNPPIIKLMLAGVGGYLITLSAYTLNELFDMKEDMVNSPSRPLVSGAARPIDAILLFTTSGLVSLILASMINGLTMIFFSIAFVMGVAYSMPVVRAKRRFPHKLVVSALGSGLDALAGGAVLGLFSPTVIIMAVSWSLFITLLVSMGDMADVKGDREARVKTLPIIMGEDGALKVMMAFPIAIGAISVIFSPYYSLNYIAPLLLLSIAVYVLSQLSELRRGFDNKRIRSTKQHFRLISVAMQAIFIIAVLPIPLLHA